MKSIKINNVSIQYSPTGRFKVEISDDPNKAVLIDTDLCLYGTVVRHSDVVRNSPDPAQFLSIKIVNEEAFNSVVDTSEEISSHEPFELVHTYKGWEKRLISNVLRTRVEVDADLAALVREMNKDYVFPHDRKAWFCGYGHPSNFPVRVHCLLNEKTSG